MAELRFDGRTAIVTGAGGNPSLGRAHAMLLAARGANVVINDIGRDPESAHYPDRASAEGVVNEIRALGGAAVADTNNIASEAGANALIQTAIDAFGSVDILVNNAGLSLAALVEEMSAHDHERHMQINLTGSLLTCRAAWPHMRAKGYGRIINTASGSFAGYAYLVAYGASKGGVFSLSRALAAEGAAHGIKVNTINPGGFTRMVTAQQFDDSPIVAQAREHFPAELASPIVGFLAHESCPVTGECFESVGGLVRRVVIAHNEGILDREIDMEMIRDRWAEIMDSADPTIIPVGDVDTTTWNFRPYKPS
jgi:NAD(P)-dependent dehydrogenase (short-subunit alcohol dehydrogenase family)